MVNRAEKRRQKKLADKAASKTKPDSSPNSSPNQPSPAIQQSLDLAMGHHAAGDLPKAEGLYRQILQTDPKQPVALHLLGVIAHQVGSHAAAAVAEIRKTAPTNGRRTARFSANKVCIRSARLADPVMAEITFDVSGRKDTVR